MEVQAPAGVVAEMQRQERRTLVHLLNYNDERRPRVEGIEVSLRAPEGGGRVEISVISPDTPVVVRKCRMKCGTAGCACGCRSLRLTAFYW